jgi:hypothetical protein
VAQVAAEAPLVEAVVMGVVMPYLSLLVEALKV